TGQLGSKMRFLAASWTGLLTGDVWLRNAFFFSSRRRHTRWPRDWSSDVCSSDLLSGGCRLLQQQTTSTRQTSTDPCEWPGLETRSEERRVGKECRLRWSPDD